MRPQALLDFLLQQLNVRQNVSYLQRGTGLCTCKNEGGGFVIRLISMEQQREQGTDKSHLLHVYLLHNLAHSEILLVKNPAPINCIWKTKQILACIWKCFILNIQFFSVNTDSLRNYLYICFLTITLHYCVINNYIQNLQLHFTLTLFWVRIS